MVVGSRPDSVSDEKKMRCVQCSATVGNIAAAANAMPVSNAPIMTARAPDLSKCLSEGAAVKVGIKKIVYTSSVAAYGVVHGHPRPDRRDHAARASADVSLFGGEVGSRGVARQLRAGAPRRGHRAPAPFDRRRRADGARARRHARAPRHRRRRGADAARVGRGRRRRGGAGAAQGRARRLQRHRRAGGDRRASSPPRATCGSFTCPRRSSASARRSARSPSGSACPRRSIRRGCGSPTCAWRCRRKKRAASSAGSRSARRRSTSSIASSPRTRRAWIARLDLLMRLVQLGTRTKDARAEHADPRARIHLRLTGPGGGDVGFLVDGERIDVIREMPRPPSTVVTMKTATFYDLLAGRTDFNTAQLTGKMRVEGEALAALRRAGAGDALPRRGARSDCSDLPRSKEPSDEVLDLLRDADLRADARDRGAAASTTASSRPCSPTSSATTASGRSSTTASTSTRTRRRRRSSSPSSRRRPKRIRLGHGVTLLPHRYNHPIRIAERIATLDILSDGRVNWGSGKCVVARRAAGRSRTTSRRCTTSGSRRSR